MITWQKHHNSVRGNILSSFSRIIRGVVQWVLRSTAATRTSVDWTIMWWGEKKKAVARVPVVEIKF